jgi:hypothetical protein
MKEKTPMASVPTDTKTTELPVTGPPPVTAPEEPSVAPIVMDEADSIQRIFEDISEAQAKVTKLGKSPVSIHKHLNQVLYPLLMRSVGLSMDLRDSVRGVAAAVAEPEEYLAGENIEFIAGYVEIVFEFVLKYGAWAREQAAAGNPDFQRELAALYQGGSGLKQVLQSLAESGDIEVEEVDDE